MHTKSATDLKQHLGATMDSALVEPIIIERSGRKSLVMLAYGDYVRLVKLCAEYLRNSSSHQSGINTQESPRTHHPTFRKGYFAENGAERRL